ncbi:protein NLRC3-like isoform X2 [Arapaima gigas]
MENPGVLDPDSDRVDLERPESPAPSYESMTSDVHDCDVEPGDQPPATGTVQLTKVESLESSKSLSSYSQPVIPGDGVILHEKEQPSEQQPGLLPALQAAQMGTESSEPQDGEKTMELPHVFKSILSAVSRLFQDELIMFKWYLSTRYAQHIGNQMDDCDDALDVVDKMLECCGKGYAVKIATCILKEFKQYDLVEFLDKNCLRVRLQYELKVALKRRYNCIFEGIARQGEQCFLSCIYIDQHLTEGSSTGVNSEHEVPDGAVLHTAAGSAVAQRKRPHVLYADS